MKEAKPFSISKQLVLEAWLKVKANEGAGGIDKETLETFEKNLKDNLYRIWNRMSSYFPLIFSQLIASVILAFTIKVRANRDMLLKYAFGINALYLSWYLIKMYRRLFYAGDFYSGIYSPVTIIVYFLLLVWFIFNYRKPE